MILKWAVRWLLRFVGVGVFVLLLIIAFQLWGWKVLTAPLAIIIGFATFLTRALRSGSSSRVRGQAKGGGTDPEPEPEKQGGPNRPWRPRRKGKF